MAELFHARLGVAALLAILAATFAGAEESGRQHTSRSGQIQLSWSSDIQPLAINRMHGWTIRLTSAAGQAIEDARISVTGGMPLHNHGLPSSPRMTEYLGDGLYRIEGMRFHMLGDWQLTFNVENGKQRDSIVVPLTILQ